MANPLLTRDGRSLALRAAVATVALLIFFAMASGVLPVQCMLTGNACREPAVTVATASPQEVSAPGALAAPSAEAAAEPAAPTLTRNDLIATTFAALPAELQHPQAASDPKSLKPNAPAAAVPPARRIVRSVAIRTDGTPDLGTLAQAYAETSSSTGLRHWPAVDAATSISAGLTPKAPPPAASEPAKTATATSPSTADTAPVASRATGKIGGGGVNVRAKPAKGASKLFSLSGGVAVQVGESKSGWIRITDPKGRSGWVYKDFLIKS